MSSTHSLNWHGNDDLLLETLTAEKTRRLTENKLAYYKPYPKQIEFHASPARERLLMAGNQLGKTLAGGYEAAMHATGIYPEWWTGRGLGVRGYRRSGQRHRTARPYRARGPGRNRCNSERDVSRTGPGTRHA